MHEVLSINFACRTIQVQVLNKCESLEYHSPTLNVYFKYMNILFTVLQVTCPPNLQGCHGGSPTFEGGWGCVLVILVRSFRHWY